MNKKVGIIVGIIILLLVGGFGYYKFTDSSSQAAQGKEKTTVTVNDRKGSKEIPLNPEKVVVLDLGSLDIMTELGIEPIALPKNSLPSYLEKYKDNKYVDLGSLKEFNIEKINELKPDLIIIEGRQEASYEELSKIAPVLYLGTADGDIFGSLKYNLNVLGIVFNNKDIVTGKLDDINKRLDAINSKVKESNATALMTMFNEGSLSVYGEGSRYDMVYSKFGFTPADANIEVSNHGQNISFEYLKEKDADYLLVLDRGAVVGGQTPAKEVVENELVKTTKAYKDGHIIYVNPQAWYIGGSGLMAVDTMLSEIEAALK